MKCSRLAEPAACKHTIMFGISPVETDKGHKCFGRSCFMSALPACGTVVSRDMRAGVLRRHEREPVAAADPEYALTNTSAPADAKICSESIVCWGLHIRHLRVPVPAFPESYLSGVDSSTESRTVYL